MKAPKFATRVQTAISGRELRIVDQPYPIWTWTLVYNFLRDPHGQGGPALGQGYDELRTLAGFFLRQQGSFQTFLYNDPTDNRVVGQPIGSGIGSLTQYQLYRTFGGFSEPITQPSGTTIYVNGTPVSFDDLGYGIVQLSAPNGSAVTADVSYNFPVRFTDDTQEYENFMYQLWSLRQLKFQSVILP